MSSISAIRFNPGCPCCDSLPGCTLVTAFQPNPCNNFSDPNRSQAANFDIPTDWTIQIFDPNTNTLVASQNASFQWTFTGAMDDTTNYQIVFTPVNTVGSSYSFFSSTFNSTLPCSNGLRRLVLPNNVLTYPQVLFFNLIFVHPTFPQQILIMPTDIIDIEILLPDGQRGNLYSLFNGYTPLQFTVIANTTDQSTKTATVIISHETCDGSGNNCHVTTTTTTVTFGYNLCDDIIINVGPF